MLQKHLIKELISNLNYEPTNSQVDLAEKLAGFIIDNGRDKIFIIKGYAGTGKTAFVASFVKTIGKYGYKSVLMAPTGRAAKVISSFAKAPALTIHKKIYRQKSAKDGFGTFILEKNLHTRTIFIVDEASMISNLKQEPAIFGSGRVLEDLIEYVFNHKGCSLILIGDPAQLPPVHSDDSPSMKIEELDLFDTQIDFTFLRDIVRQEQTSGILHNATIVRELIDTGNISLPRFVLKNFSDIQRLTGDMLIEAISDSYDGFGMDETIVICRSNKRANKYNEGIRKSILWRESELEAGELLMVVKNNYFWLRDEEAEVNFIANGDIVEVLKVHRYEEVYGYRFADVTIRLIDYNTEIDCKLLLDSLTSESASLSPDENKKLFYSVLEDYADLKPKRKQFDNVRSNVHFNALQVKYAYAVTCHKAQGGQWTSVFIDQGYFKEDMLSKEYLRWLYTALTRGTKKVHLVNFPDDLFV